MPCQMVWMRCSGVVKAVLDSQQRSRRYRPPHQQPHERDLIDKPPTNLSRHGHTRSVKHTPLSCPFGLVRAPTTQVRAQVLWCDRRRVR